MTWTSAAPILHAFPISIPAMRLIHPIVLSIAALCTTPAMAQQPAPALTFDPSVLFTAAQDLLRQTPDAQIDGLYLAL